jgi:hypothetical protein
MQYMSTVLRMFGSILLVHCAALKQALTQRAWQHYDICWQLTMLYDYTLASTCSVLPNPDHLALLWKRLVRALTPKHRYNMVQQHPISAHFYNLRGATAC